MVTKLIINNFIRMFLIGISIYILHIGILNPYQVYCNELNCIPTLTFFYLYCIFMNFLHGLGIFLIFKLFTNFTVKKIVLLISLLVVFSIFYKLSYINFSLHNIYLLTINNIGKIVSLMFGVYFISNKNIALKAAYILIAIISFVFIVGFS